MDQPSDMPSPPPTPSEGASLLARARALPAVAGVYLMKDAAGVVLYVGKANNLPDRVRNWLVCQAGSGIGVPDRLVAPPGCR